LKLIHFILPFVFLLGCSAQSKLEVDIKVRHSLMLGPETEGNGIYFAENGLSLDGQFGAVLNTASKLSLARSSQSKDFFRSNPTSVKVDTDLIIDASEGVGLNFSLGILRRLDIIFDTSTDSNSLKGIKLQVYGDPGHDVKGYKFSIAALHGHGSGEEKNSVSHDIFSDKEDREVDFDNVSSLLTQKSIHLSGIFGYRKTKGVLYYLSTYYAHHDVDDTLNIADQQTFLLDAEGEVTSAHLGVILSSKSGFQFFQLEVGHNSVRFSNDRRSGISGAMNSGINF
jgi:hypothetical protein